MVSWSGDAYDNGDYSGGGGGGGDGGDENHGNDYKPFMKFRNSFTVFLKYQSVSCYLASASC